MAASPFPHTAVQWRVPDCKVWRGVVAGWSGGGGDGSRGVGRVGIKEVGGGGDALVGSGEFLQLADRKVEREKGVLPGKVISLDLRERIVSAYEGKEGTREEVAKRFKVSVGMVKKLLSQRNRTGDLRPRYSYCGRKARLEPEHGERMRKLVVQEPDVTLEEIKQRLELGCTIGAIHWVLCRMGLTYKKRRSTRLSKTGPTSRKTGGGGSEAKAGSIRRGSSSSTSRRPRRT